MANRKRKSTAAKQRAKLRQQRRAAAAAQTGQQPSTDQAATRQAQAAVRRPGDRPPRSPKRRRSNRTPWVLIAGVVGVLVVLVVMFLTRTDDTSRGDASAGSIEKLTSVPVETLESVGVPDQPSNVNPLPTDTAPVEVGGKPAVVYVGADYCPFCAVERWPMVVALSRFGTLSGLEPTTSAPPPETLPNTPSVSFSGATFESDLLAFSAVETHTRDFTPIEEPNDLQQRLFDTYNVESVTGSSGGIPFVMVGNLYAWAGSQYDYTVLEDKDFDQIANALANPDTDIAREIGGAANYLTAMICQLTDGQPEDVCSSAVIQQAQAALPTP
jgi:Domain of unknown function (DUF929)